MWIEIMPGVWVFDSAFELPAGEPSWLIDASDLPY